MKKVLITFVGSNDFHKDRYGAVLTVFKKKKFDEVHLLWNANEFTNFYEIAKYVRSEIEKRKYCKNVSIHLFECEDVTDHNEIYPKLLEICRSIYKKENEYTAAIASGTPSMQACWILIAESGDFPMKLIRSVEAKYGRPVVRDVKLNSSLPRILRLKEENEELKIERKNLLPLLKLNISKAEIYIGKEELNLSPVEFSYFRYFLERAYKELEYLRIDIVTVPEEFYNSILKFNRESYPQADTIRMDSEKNKCITTPTFRGNISRLNKKIRTLIDNDARSNYLIIESVGERFKKSYGINLSKEKIKIIK